MSLHTRMVLRKALRSVRRTMIRWGWRLVSCGTGPRTGEAKAGRLGRCECRAFEVANLGYTKSVTIGGKVATFKVVGPTAVTATVPAGAVTGKITVTTPYGSATSTKSFFVLP